MSLKAVDGEEWNWPFQTQDRYLEEARWNRG
jgi:hypothetical protein